MSDASTCQGCGRAGRWQALRPGGDTTTCMRLSAHLLDTAAVTAGTRKVKQSKHESTALAASPTWAAEVRYTRTPKVLLFPVRFLTWPTCMGRGTHFG